MTERLSDKRLYQIAQYDEGECFTFSVGSPPMKVEAAQMARELLDLRITVRELRNNLGILEVVLADKDAKLAAGPVMPEEPSECALSAAAVVFLPRFGPRVVYGAIRDTLLAEQNGARGAG